MKSTFLLLFALIQANGFSQSIIGKVHDENEKVLPLANVLLLTTKDSALVKGFAPDAGGSFAFDKVRLGPYFLFVLLIRYKKAYSAAFTVAAETKELRIPVVQLGAASRELKEVTVSGKRPFLEQKINHTVVTISNSFIAGGNTVLDVLCDQRKKRLQRCFYLIRYFQLTTNIIQSSYKRLFYAKEIFFSPSNFFFFFRRKEKNMP